MRCWGRKTGSDDLKEKKLLEEIERTRDSGLERGTGKRYWGRNINWEEGPVYQISIIYCYDFFYTETSVQV